jgi:plasmid stabilization system protein ParE
LEIARSLPSDAQDDIARIVLQLAGAEAAAPVILSDDESRRLPRPRTRQSEANLQPRLKSARLGPNTACEAPLHASGAGRSFSILTYISATSPQGAARVQKRIQDVISLLLAHPEIGLRTNDSDIRRLTTTPYPFLVFYEIGSQEIIIHAIRHGARDHGGMPGKRGSG